MKSTKALKTLAFASAALGVLALAAPAQAAPTYQFRQSSKGVVETAPVAAPGAATGDGTSKAGACASGARSDCITWSSSGVDARITLSGSPLLNMVTNDCHGTAACTVKGTKSYTSGKWYWEYTLTQMTPGYGGLEFGIVKPGSYFPAASDTGVYYYTYSTGYFYVNGASVPISNAGHVTGDVFGFALDMDAKTLTVTRNGSLLKTTALPSTMTTVTPGAGEDWYVQPNGLRANFGQSNFAYPVPSGYNAGLW